MKRQEIKEKFNKWFVDNYGTDFTNKHEELDEDDVIDFVEALSIQNVSNQRELLISFSEYLHKRDLLNVVKENIPTRVKLFLKRN